ncbi:TRAP transporter large permease [Jiella pacifica]|uniref:TRAP transporter large permease subunit n=1 Tax=Jiella pacifica TaxID=2696469 RepID=A0A6N9T7G0_9HYPH|nr:TRAP transporter large permease subunit [Jiella pacifica]NDW07344.1 TRAP transporter large permease subunit [Jiella pacifica]
MTHAMPAAAVNERISDWLDAAGKMLVHALRWPGKVAVALGGVAIVALMGLTVADVVLRNLFSVVVPGSLELTGLLTIPVVLAAVGVVEIERNHVKVDLLLNAMPDYLRAPTVVGGLLLALTTMLVTAYQMSEQVLYLQGNAIVTGVLGLPEWPFIAAAAIFVFLFSLALLANLMVAVGTVARQADVRALAWLVVWVAVVAVILVLCFEPDLLPFELSRSAKGVAAITLCFVLIFLGVQVAVAMALTGLLGISLLISTGASLTSLGTTTIDVVSDETWSVVPLFTWMGLIVVASGFAAELYRSAYRWVGHLPGGLASASTIACAGLSSIVGDTLSGVYTMGSIALPEMRAYRYDMKLATASVACAATIGVMIPPSLAFIVYGMITEVSIGKLFMAGVLPGILFAVILICLITLRATLNPELAPRGERSSWRERFKSSTGTWPILLLMLLVLGGIYSGAVTPNEAAGVGVFGAIVIALAMRRIDAQKLAETITATLRLTAGIIIIFMFAAAFSRFIALSGLTQQLATLVVGLDLGRYEIIAAILLFYVVIGMFMNALPALVLTVPIFFPIAMNAGFDPVWFGVLVVIMVELGVVTPPIGVNVFAIATIAKDVPMYDIFRGVLPFWLAYVLLIVLIVIFPEISLWLPSLM